MPILVIIYKQQRMSKCKTLKSTKSLKRKLSMPLRKNIPQYIRKEVWLDYFPNSVALCPACNLNQITPFDFHAGHIESHRNGGATIVKNLMPICASCNIQIGRRDMVVEGNRVNLAKTFKISVIERKIESKSLLSNVFSFLYKK